MEGTGKESLEHLDPRLREILSRLPREPGIYMLKDPQAQVVYVGKAKNLFARVRSYFLPGSGDTRAFVPLLAGLVADVETVVTSNEKEALLLENTLIKQHQPRLNVKLRDDKNYLVLRLDPDARFPRLEVVRRIRDDGARYFGPYHSAVSCRAMLRLINRHFQLRTCSDRVLDRRTRPCLQHAIGRCLAPCVLPVSVDQYAQQVQDVTLFLRGRGEELLKELEARMREAAALLHFEQAARLRDQQAALRAALMGQQVVSDSLDDQDVFGFYREGDRLDAVVLLIRGGTLVGRRSFSLGGQEFPDEEVLSSLVGRFYDELGEPVPRRLLLPLAIEDQEVKQRWLAELSGHPVEIRVPRRGPLVKLLDLALRNARAGFETRRQRNSDLEQALATLMQRLRLERLPRRIECFDISSLAQAEAVASMVVLDDGVPCPSRYRRFKIRGQSQDDFAAMYEVLSRRLRRAREGEKGWELPDLLVVDGGKAQLSMAQAALRDVGLPEGGRAPDLVALAKERPDPEDRSRAATDGPARPDRVFLPRIKDPIRLRPNTAELFLLSRLRDEAHRFAIAYQRRLRQRRTLRSGLEDIPGVGPSRRRQLLRHFGSLKRVRSATLDELQAVPGLGPKAACAIARYFASGVPDETDDETDA